MSVQAIVRYVPGMDGARLRIAVTFPAAPGATVVTVTDLATNLNVALTAGATVADVNDALTIHYDTADIIGLNLETVGQKQLAIHFTPTVGTPEQALLEVLPGDAISDLYDGAVWMQDGAPAGGTIRGVDATKANPTSDLANALNVLGQLGLGTIKVYFAGTAAVLDMFDDMTGVSIEGVSGFPPIAFDALSGTILSGAHIKRCAIEGDLGELDTSADVDDIRTNESITFEGLLLARNSFFGHNIFQDAAKFAQALIAFDCEFVPLVGAIGTPIDIDFQDNPAFVFLAGMRGRVRIMNNSQNVGSADIVAMREGASFTIDVSSDGDATYAVSGHGLVLDETVAGANIVRDALLDYASIGFYVLVDQREYVQDGPNQLQVKCRRSYFTTDAARAAAAIVGAGLVPPFVEGRHIGSVKTEYVETTPGANPGEALIHTVRTL